MNEKDNKITPRILQSKDSVLPLGKACSRGLGEKKALSTEPYKGVRDFYPEDMAVQNYIFGVWKKVAEEFGYQEYASSLLEPAELYRTKGNDEIVNEQMFTFTDRGEREVALRPEMTPSLARMVAARLKSLKFPLRWYTIANCFRYERPQRGRRREHWQLNADVMGIGGVEAEVEIISLAHAIMKAFGAKDEDFEIRVNNRQLLIEWFSKKYGITDENSLTQVMRTLDRKAKITEAEFKNELTPILQDKYEAFRKELDLDIDSFVQMLNAEKQHSTLIKLKSELENKENPIKIIFDKTIARGFDYYTGMVFEVFDTHAENRRSLFGGGRYDNLLEMFGVDPVPTVGVGMGDITIRDFLETHKLPTTVSSPL